MSSIEPIRALWNAWRTWSAPGSPNTANTYPRPVHEYPLAQSELFRLKTEPRIQVGGLARLPHTVPPRDVFDGRDLDGLTFRARTLTLIATDGKDPLTFNFDTPRPEVPTTSNPSGTITVDVRGLHAGGVYWRRFDLTPYKAIEINCQTWRRIRVLPLFSQLSGFDLVAILTEETAHPGRRDRVFYAQSLSKGITGTATIWETPPGAVAILPNFTAGSAKWQSYSDRGLRVEVPIAGGAGLVTGVRELVGGAQLQVGALDLGGSVIWEIEI